MVAIAVFGFEPYVRYARRHEQLALLGPVRALDHRLFFCHSGSGKCLIQDKIYDFLPGTVLYIPAGVPYMLDFGEDKPVFTGCNFDFYQNHSQLSEPIPPVAESAFKADEILEKEIFSEGQIFAQPVCVEKAFFLEYRFQEITEEFKRHSLYWDAYCGTALKAVLIRIAQLLETRSAGIDEEKGKTILGYIHAHCHEALTNRTVAEYFGYHEDYFSTLVRKYTGMPLHRYVLRYKMHLAVELLQTTDLSVGEVAVKVGMPDMKHFSKCFKNIMGVPPSQFRAGLKK